MCICLHVTSGDDVVCSGGPSTSMIEVPSVSESRHSTIHSKSSVTRRKTPWVPLAADSDSDEGDVEYEVVTKLVQNETMKQGARS